MNGSLPRALTLVLAAVLLATCDYPALRSRAAPITSAQPSIVSTDPADLSWEVLTSADGQIPVAGPAEQTLALVFDVDRDGLNDIVIGGRKAAPALTWLRRTASGWERHVIEAARLSIEAGGTAYDVDGDGDLDLIAGEDYSGTRLYWWENPYPSYRATSSWRRHGIKVSGNRKHHDQIVGDFDGDGAAELVFWNQGLGGQESVLWRAVIPRNPRELQSWPLERIFSSRRESEGLAAADIDGDGVTDLVGGGYWFRHQGSGAFLASPIDLSVPFTRVAVGQLIPGGRPEIVQVAGDEAGPARWYRWDGSRWVARELVAGGVDHGHSLEVADINGDGRLDIFCAEMNLGGGNPDARTLILLGDGAGAFTTVELARGHDNHESRIADLDGDGDLDILGKPYNLRTPALTIWLQDGADLSELSLGHWRRQVIDPARPWRALFITAADVDGDGRRDIVTGGWWYHNPGRTDTTWERRAIGAPLSNMAAVYDFDDDGDADILGTQGKGAERSAQLLWARNSGTGSFTILKNIAAARGDFLQGVAVGRFGTGGSLDVALSWHEAGHGVQALALGANPVVDQWAWRQLSPTSQDEALTAGDIDRDGDLDLLLGTRWLRNDGSAWRAMTISAGGGMPDRNRLGDINGDGRLDAVVGFEAISEPGPLVWYEQGTDPGAPWSEHLIATVTGPMSLDVGDLDRDGDLDVVVGEHNLADPSSARLIIYENAAGDGSDWAAHIVYTGDEHHNGAQLADIDGDGDLDILSIGWGHDQVVLYENLAPRPRGPDDGLEAPVLDVRGYLPVVIGAVYGGASVSQGGAARASVEHDQDTGL